MIHIVDERHLVLTDTRLLAAIELRHALGIVDLATDLIGEVGVEIEPLVVAAQVEATSVVGHDLANVGNVGIINRARAVEVLEAQHAGEGSLSVGTWEARVGVTGAGDGGRDVGDALLEDVLAIDDVEIIDGIETDAFRLETLHNAHRHILGQHEVVAWHLTGTEGARTVINVLVLGQLVNVVVVEVVGQREIEVEVLGVDEQCIESQLEALVGGLAHVAHLIDVARRSVDLGTHQEVLGGVPINVQRTIEAIEEAEIKTDVAADGGLPLQRRVGLHAGGGINVDGLAIPRGSRDLPSLIPERGVDVVSTRSSVRETKLEVVEPILGILQEGFITDTPSEGCSGESGPMIIGGELRRTVGTERGSKQIATQKRIVDSAEPRHSGFWHTDVVGVIVLGGMILGVTHL